MTTQTAGFTFPSSSLPNRCFSGALSRNRISSPFLLQTPHAVRISRCTELRPELMATPAHGELLSLSRVAELAGARAAELLPQGRLPASARPGAEPLAAGSGSPPRRRGLPLLMAAAPRGQSAQVCAWKPLHGARRWPRRRSPRPSTRAHQRRRAPLPAARRRSFGRRSWWPIGKVSGLLQVYVECV
jgi:hypothetical protein